MRTCGKLRSDIATDITSTFGGNANPQQTNPLTYLNLAAMKFAMKKPGLSGEKSRTGILINSAASQHKTA